MFALDPPEIVDFGFDFAGNLHEFLRWILVTEGMSRS